MITPTAYRGQHIGIFGLARSGRAAAESLVRAGVHVHAWDDTAAARSAVSADLDDLYALDFTALDGLVLAPGVPLTHPKPHPLVEKAQAAETPILSDFDLFEGARSTLPSHSVVGITGTNGKSTVTAMLAHVMAACGRPSCAAGNIGVGVMDVDPLDEGGVYVFEMSSFQLDITQHLRPDIAILLNITPDHLDRHGSMAGYVAAKARIFDRLSEDGLAIIGVDDAHGAKLYAGMQGQALALSTERAVDGYFTENGRIYRRDGDRTSDLGPSDVNPRMKGVHNQQNILAVWAAAHALGLEDADIRAAIAGFAGLAHRQQWVATIDGVTYVNDSKATNVDAALRALTAFSSVHWIAGGRAKGPLDADWGPALSGVRRAYLIGEAAPALAQAIEGTPADICASLDDAVIKATAAAQPGDTVLLSPACTAFDQFSDYERRGEAFVAAVRALEGPQP